MTATIDVISNGRLELGLGAGWDKQEYQAYGIPFPKPSIRIAQMREGIEIIKQLWTEKKASFRGNYFSLNQATCEPKPLQKPHPPITIGGSGEKLLLKVVALFADRSNFFGSTMEFAHKLKVLKNHCLKVGRNYDEIEKSWSGRIMVSDDRQKLIATAKKLHYSGKIITNFSGQESFEKWFERTKNEGLIGTPSECIAKIKKYVDLGVTYFMLSFLDSPSTNNINLFAKKIKMKL
jgi:alkanesulfonate monooxygenase SsuD/methylene tetrahydromethanopterin reductase-like flavin-dependent oxidoreductase (luciferase family)